MLSPMKFFDVNYIEYNTSVTGTNLTSATSEYCYDNRSDAGNTVYTAQSGTLLIVLNGSYTLKDFFVLGTNIKTGYIQVYNGSWTTVGSFNASDGDHYISYATSIASVTQVQLVFSATITGAVAYLGEFIATKEKFTLIHNPINYVPKLIYPEKVNELFIGIDSSADLSVVGRFRADIGWEYLMGNSSAIAATDLDNVTTLLDQRVSFLFWPNGNTSGAGLPKLWRKQDIYKCKIHSDYSAPMASTALDYVIATSFTIKESR